ncbi:restriction endonuclease subunit S [Vibrio parahaemolyticus]|uniref:restriction endonuclease subunit S n=1 Tax=Vibrio TaxID=662 RepID=UPI0023EC07A6|nr:restriction endonuclease subunit S [Vibrio parahaemolyticus]MDF5032645.1 restriction endonuclease subunit S [Vibrio parahaemolyticus]MDF5167763.1 restriction endonuclease subunit S [Vibrio parahaemolyticus]WOO27049.1 restriction endonuclease subunit S [Vibrio parahaemolyticus]HCM0782743.1 restriction endonuclease subunit S [Vibrio parahaemolyticus]HDF7652419.1 restriction endonuclease subunit S [Vibrio parahaemolyticus]
MVPNGWEKSPVGKLCKSIVPGRNKPKVFDGDIPWVTTPEISGKYIPSAKQKNYISQSVAKECGAKIVPKGAVIIAAVGELGLTAIAKEEIILNQQLHAFVCPPNVNNEYLAYFLSAQKPYMDTVASKTTIPYMNKSNCESIPVLLPPLPEQHKIAQILSTWDKAITTTEKLIDVSKQQKKALMQQLLTGKKRLIDPETGKTFEGEWSEFKLSDIANYTKGYTYKSHEYSEEPTEYGFLTLKSILRGGGYSKKGIKYLNEKVDNKFSVKEGDVVFAVTDLTRNAEVVGAPIIVPNLPYENIFISMDLMQLEVSSSFNKIFLFYLLKLRENRNFMRARASGSTVLHLDIKGSKKMPLKLPSSIEEQQKIASVLTTADKEIELLEAKLAHFKQEKKALMQQLLTGKRRVKVAETEAA